MTREEQIENTAIREQRLLMESIDWRCGFKSGVRWADNNPNLTEEEQVGMGGLGMEWQKQTLIKKACEWLEQHKEDYNKYDAWIGDYVDFNALITDLRRYLEE